MLNPRIKAALVVLAASAGLSACASYGPYGGSGVSVGVGYGSPYGYGYGSPYGYGYGSPYGYGSSYYGGYPYFGWYDGFYYPGSGYWVYDPYGNQHPITRHQSEYWNNVLKKFRAAHNGTAATQTAIKENFSGFRSQAKEGATISGVSPSALGEARSARQLNERRRERLQVQGRAEANANASADRESIREIVRARQEAQSARQQERQQSVRERIQERRARRAPDG